MSLKVDTYSSSIAVTIAATSFMESNANYITNFHPVDQPISVLCSSGKFFISAHTADATFPLSLSSDI